MKKEINFTVHSSYQPAGDQPTAIKVLTDSILKGNVNFTPMFPLVSL